MLPERRMNRCFSLDSGCCLHNRFKVDATTITNGAIHHEYSVNSLCRARLPGSWRRADCGRCILPVPSFAGENRTARRLPSVSGCRSGRFTKGWKPPATAISKRSSANTASTRHAPPIATASGSSCTSIRRPVKSPTAASGTKAASATRRRPPGETRGRDAASSAECNKRRCRDDLQAATPATPPAAR